MNIKKFRIGIVGIGAIANLHARAIHDLTHATLVGGCCRQAQKGRQFADEHQCAWYATADELLDQEELDLITICTPSGAHLEPALAAIRRGVHVLCEKPIEITLSRAQQMIDAAAAAQVCLGGVFPLRFNPLVQAAHAAAAQGRLGQLAVASVMVPWWRDDAYYAPDRWQGTLALDGGGALINQSIHAIDAMQWIAAAAGCGRIQEVFGLTARRGHASELIEVEDTAVAALRFENGAVGQILAATSLWPGSSQRLLFAGREGTIEIHEQELRQWQFRQLADDDDQIRQRFSQPGIQGGAADPLAIDYSNHTRNIQDFLAALEHGREPSINGQEACKALAIIRAVYESAECGQPVRLPEPA